MLERTGQVDEYVAILQERGKGAKIDANGERTSVQGHSIVILPPGDSRIVLPNGGRVVRLLTTRSKDLAAKCSNADAYAERHTPTSRHWSPGPTRRAASACAPTASTCRPRKGASARSGAAPPSWSTCSRRWGPGR
ncbi:MAG: hypothetical protein WDN45_16085 [Caulobacteraceae bacterium]